MSAIADRILNMKDLDPQSSHRGRLRKHGDRTSPGKVTEAEARKLARDVLRRDVPIAQALRAAGYSEKQSLKGLQRVRDSQLLRAAFAEEAKAIEQDAKKPQLFPSEQALEGLIMNRLEKNIIKGEDKAVMSCKLAGSHRRLSLWEPDYRTGVIILNAPPDLDLSEKIREQVPDE